MKEKRIVYPGSFDPPTTGHLDLIRRACALADEVVVAVGINPEKQSFFTLEERMDMLRRSTAGLPVRVESFSGLLADFCRREEIYLLLRGLRNAGDLQYEAPMAVINGKLLPGLETVFLLARPELMHVSSTMARELGRQGADLSGCLPPEALATAEEGFRRAREEDDDGRDEH